MASALISSILKATTDWLSLIHSTPSTSSTTTNVADDLEKLERMLQRIKAVLVDAEEREIIDESIKLWLKELKDVAYDAEDVLEEYQYHVLRAQVENRAITAATATATSDVSRKRKHVDGEEEVILLASSASSIAASKVSILNSLANRIKNIRKRFKEISKDRDRLHLKPEDGRRRSDGSSEYPQPSSHMVNEQDIYGREDEKKKLIDWLLSDNESKFEVLAVVGKGGLGKTTLAQLVFNNQTISDYFGTRMWVCVSGDFNLIKLTRAMVENITGESCALSELSVLQRRLQENLNGKRVLLVLDDVWNEKKDLWESLCIPFHGAQTFRVILTTRNYSVAEAMQTTVPCRLGYLPEEQCRNLFFRRAFCGRVIEQFPNLVEIGWKIVSRCGGLPLAVKSLAGLLQQEPDEDRWKDVQQSNLWELSEGTDILPALKLSYNRMPSHLKPCFLICPIFPKGHIFIKDEVVKLWASHGYIQHKFGARVDKVGSDYFNELHRRSFFDEHLNGTFKMHDNILDLAQYISGNKIRHLFINDQFYGLPLDTRALRTVMLYRDYIDTTRTKYENLVEWITSLRHLRYLKLSFQCREEGKPGAIEKLTCLRQCREACELVFTVPEAIENLTCLRYLELRTEGTINLTDSIARLYNLNVLKLICYQFDGLRTLGQLPSLKCLNLRLIRSYSDRTTMKFDKMFKWEQYDRVMVGNFYELQELIIDNCGGILGSLGERPYLSTIHNLNRSSICLPPGFGKNNRLECLKGRFEVRIDDIVGILKNLVNIAGLNIEKPGMFHYRLAFDFDVKSELGLSIPFSEVCLVVVDEESDKNITADYEKSNQIEQKSFLVLENLKPHSTLVRLYLEGYHGIRWPSWIGHPSMNKLTEIYICHSCNDQLPTFGQIPSLRYLTLDSISSLKVIGYEFSHGMNLNEVAFPSLISLKFQNMLDWEEWLGVLKGDFPQLQELTMHDCPALSSLSPLRILHSIERFYQTGCHAHPLSGLNSLLALNRGKSSHSPFNKLSTLCIGFCSNDRLPALGQLPSLRFLTLKAIAGLKTVGGEYCRGTSSCHEVAFPFLTELDFEDMPDWEEWHGLQDGGDFPHPMSLRVVKCPKLWSFPPASSLPPNVRVQIIDCPMLLL